MAIIKQIDAKDDIAMSNFVLTKSGQGLIIRNVSGVDNPMNQANPQYLTKQDLYNDIQAQRLFGNLKEPQGVMYDHVVVEFGNDAQYAEKAAKLIVERFHKPDLTIVKNQGNGRIQEKKVNGTKEVLYDLHQERNGDWHLHVLVSRYSINNQLVEPQVSLTDKYVRDKYFDVINKDLEANGLARLQGGFTTGITSKNTTDVKPSITTQAEVKQLQLSEDVSEALEKIDYSNASISDVALDEALTKAENELAKLVENAKRKGEELKQLQQAKLVKQQNESLKDNVEELTKNVENLQEEVKEKERVVEEKELEIEALNVKNGEKQNEVNNLLEQLMNKDKEILEFSELLTTAEEEIQQKSVALIQLNKERDEIVSKLESAQNEVKRLQPLEKEVEDLMSKNSLLEATNEAKDATISAKQTQIETQTQRNNELDEFNKKLQKQAEDNERRVAEFAEKIRQIEINSLREKEEAIKREEALQRQISELQSTVAKKEKENSILVEFLDVVEKKLEQASKVINSLSTKLRNATQKNFIKEFIDSNNEVKQAIQNLDKENDEKKAQIDALRAKFNANAPKVDNFTQSIKRDGNDNSNTKSTGPKKPS